jgi:hypothetical protein
MVWVLFPRQTNVEMTRVITSDTWQQDYFLKCASILNFKTKRILILKKCTFFEEASPHKVMALDILASPSYIQPSSWQHLVQEL